MPISPQSLALHLSTYDDGGIFIIIMRRLITTLAIIVVLASFCLGKGGASDAQGTYKVPIVSVPTNPFDALFQYPMEKNGFKANDTHVFWPAYQKIFSKFYMNLPHEDEKMFGISEQIFMGLLGPNEQYQIGDR